MPLLGTPALAQTHGDAEVASNHATIRSSQLLAQRVIDGLPPPPPIPDLQSPDSTNLPIGSGPQVQEDDSGELYMVYVNGDSPLLLEQVQRVEPTATVQPFEGQQVILAGLFEGSRRASEQVDKLSQRGIEANVASVSSVVLSPNSDRAPDQTAQASLNDLPPGDPEPSVNRANGSPRPSVSVAPPSGSSAPAPPTQITNSPRQDDAYYVVIPGELRELGGMRDQVVLLGALPNSVEQRDRPLGPHLLIGPFVDQDAATRWNRYFQDFGMNARVYYKR